MSRTFPLGPIVSAYLNQLVCPFDEYREFLSYMCRADVPLWDVERARAHTQPSLEKQVPQLKDIKMPEKTDNGTANRYVRTVGRNFGYVDVTLKPVRNKFAVRTLSQAIK